MTFKFKCNNCKRVIERDKKPFLWRHLDCVKCGGRFELADEFEPLSEGLSKEELEELEEDSEDEEDDDDVIMDVAALGGAF